MRQDEAGTASPLQGSESRAVDKDSTHVNSAVNRLKQTTDVGLYIHAIPLADVAGTSSARVSGHVAHVLVIAQSEAKCLHSWSS